jgi:cytochrome c-type biogenesis protein CcmH/NrfF
VELPTELRRIRSSALLACTLLFLFVFLEPPISILGWVLYGAGLLSLLYVALASILVLKKTRSHDNDVRRHE